MVSNVIYEYNGRDSSIMFTEEEGYEGVIVFAEDSDESVTRTPIPANECHALALALDPSHAALVARLRDAIRYLNTAYNGEYGDGPNPDDVIEVTVPPLLPGDLGATVEHDTSDRSDL